MPDPAGARGPVPVVHIITRLELGGAQENTLHTVRHLDRSVFRPFLLAGPGGILDEEARAIPGVETSFMPHLARPVRPAADLRAYRELAGALTDIRRRHPGPLIVHTHSSKAGILGRWAARAAGAEVIVHSIHGFGFTPGQPGPVRGLFILAERLTARITDAFIAVSRANLEEGSRRGLFDPDRATLIRSGFVLDDFARPGRTPAEVRRELGLAEDAPVVLMVACFKSQKAPADFVRMAARVAPMMPTARFLAAGDGELRGEMERAVAAAGLGDRILLLGWRRDIPDLMRAADVLVLTSRWEGLPRVVPQAMAAGKPVVATAVDGTPEVVIEGVTGHLVAPGDTAAMADRVAALLRDPARAREMGREGRQRVAEFDAGLMVRRQEELYRRLLAGRGGHGRG